MEEEEEKDPSSKVRAGHEICLACEESRTRQLPTEHRRPEDAVKPESYPTVEDGSHFQVIYAERPTDSVGG
jgi:hypothetical protein